MTKLDSDQFSTSSYGMPTSNASLLLSGLGILTVEVSIIDVTSTKNDVSIMVPGATRQFSAIIGQSILNTLVLLIRQANRPFTLILLQGQK